MNKQEELLLRVLDWIEHNPSDEDLKVANAVAEEVLNQLKAVEYKKVGNG